MKMHCRMAIVMMWSSTLETILCWKKYGAKRKEYIYSEEHQTFSLSDTPTQWGSVLMQIGSKFARPALFMIPRRHARPNTSVFNAKNQFIHSPPQKFSVDRLQFCKSSYFLIEICVYTYKLIFEFMKICNENS